MIDYESLTASIGNSKVVINRRLVEKKNLSPEQVVRILSLHELKLAVLVEMEKKGSQDPSLKSFAEHLESLEYQLQDAWGFPRNNKYHRFWEAPHCTCPKMDNEDRYPTGYYVTNMQCPIHGECF